MHDGSAFSRADRMHTHLLRQTIWRPPRPPPQTRKRRRDWEVPAPNSQTIGSVGTRNSTTDATRHPRSPQFTSDDRPRETGGRP